MTLVLSSPESARESIGQMGINTLEDYLHASEGIRNGLYKILNVF